MGYETMGFFYGKNIHPEGEWRLRKDAVVNLSEMLGLSVEVQPYAPSEWFEEVSRFADSPEGGERCGLCFRLQLSDAAGFAAKAGFRYLCTTLTISPHKDPELVNEIGRRVCDGTGIEWMRSAWRKKGGFGLSVERSKEWGLYRQNYCGCYYSLKAARAKESICR
jgi:predicted adenine nucleotide alpha hydrolase (AANH) superfamily ATPase